MPAQHSHPTDEPTVTIRHREYDAAKTLLMQGSSVLLVGGVGSGKSFLSDQLLTSLTAGGFSVVKVRGLYDRTPTQWAAVAAAFGVVIPPELDNRQIETLFNEQIIQTRGSSERRIVLLIDDALRLDYCSAEWINRLARESAAPILASVDFALETRADDRSEVAQIFRALWTDGIAERIDLSRLDDSATLRLADTFGEENTLDLASQQYVVRHASGVPLLVRELVQDQLEREREEGLLSKGRIGQRLSGMRQTQQAISPAPFAITGPRAFDLGRSRVIGLAPAQLEALVNLSKLGTMPMRRAGQLVGFDTLGALMRGGHVVPDSADRDFVYSLAADAASGAAVADPDGVQRLADRMVETILEDSASGLQMSSLEAMFVATVLEHRPLQEMHKYRERYGNSALGHVHIVAAGQASASGLFHDALGHARRAERLNPVLPAYIEMAKALANMGQHSAARAALERGRDYCAARPDDLNWLRWVIRLRSAENHEHINDLCAQAVGWHPGDATFAAECTLASLVVYSSAAARLPAVREIVDDNRVDTLTRLKACGYLALNSAYAGQSVGVVYACAAAIEFEEVHYDDQYDQLSLREMAVLVFAQIGTAQVMTRTDLNQLGHHIERRMSSAVKHHDYSYVAPLGATLGYLASERGDFLQAELELRRAAERYTGTDPGWRKAWAGCLHVSVLASLGRVHEAQRGLADIRHPSKPETSWYSYAYFSAEMALHKARGRYDEAREIALNLANAGQWSPLIQVEQLFAASALGEPAKHVASVAAEAAHSTTSQSLIAMADFLVAKEREDAEAAYESGNRLAELRMPEAAQVAFDYAAQRFSTIGDKRQAKEALTRANGLVDAMCGQPPASTREFDFSALSGREVEIAQLVAAGRTNREIAEQLFLSVRTVESHVYRVLRKLQVATRRELLECMVSG